MVNLSLFWDTVCIWRLTLKKGYRSKCFTSHTPIFLSNLDNLPFLSQMTYERVIHLKRKPKMYSQTCNSIQGFLLRYVTLSYLNWLWNCELLNPEKVPCKGAFYYWSALNLCSAVFWISFWALGWALLSLEFLRVT